jgi:hypothetical protein
MLRGMEVALRHLEGFFSTITKCLSGTDMNRLINDRLIKNRLKQPAVETHPLYRPTKRLRQDADALLREMAYVLHLVRKVKEQVVSF